MTQARRLLAYLRQNPGASSLEVTRDLLIVNVTGRVSDLRARGYEVQCITRTDGNKGYVVREAAQLALSLT